MSTTETVTKIVDSGSFLQLQPQNYNSVPLELTGAVENFIVSR